jgi:hypothetical protein
MNARERVLAALDHRQPNKVPWAFDFTGPALAKLADYYRDARLADPRFFDVWVGNHFRFVEPRGNGQFHGLEEEVEPGLWRDGWGVIWDSHSNTSIIASRGVVAPESLSSLEEAVGVTPETTDSSLAGLGSDESLAFFVKLRS